MRVIVTRPAAQAAEWVTSLQQHGLDAVALPLIAIVAPPDPAAVQRAWATLAERRLVVFVSPNAAQSFFDLTPAGQNWPPELRAASPGPGTTALLCRLGVPMARIVEPAADAPQFDSEALWRRLAADDWQGASVLVVRGVGGRDWLATRLLERGARMDSVAAYARAAPVFSAQERAVLDAAVSEPAGHLWLFSSSEAIERLAGVEPAALCGTASDPGATWARARAIATHPRIAARAQQLGIKQVSLCRPTLSAVVGCIQSMGL